MIYRFSVLFFLTLNASLGFAQKSTEWHLAYWMPYDNNLNSWSDSIVNMIASKMPNDISASVQVDRSGAGGMERFQVNAEGVKNPVRVESDDSSNSIQLDDYLNWVTDSFKAKRYAIIFLDHGGRLDEVGLDEFPRKSFLKIDSISLALEAFNRRVNDKIDLVYFQVCAKGSIEPIYEVSENTDFILVSQNTLGAPNFYYSPFFEKLGEKKAENGADLALLIVENERDDMYYSQTCIRTDAIDGFNKAFHEFIQGVSNTKVRLNILAIPYLRYADQGYWDFIGFLNALESKELQPKIQELIEATNSLIQFHYKNPSNMRMKNYSGLSFLALTSIYNQLLEVYGHLKFFKTFDMSVLIDNIEIYRK